MWRSIIKRNYSQLLQRSLIKVEGPDAAPFLQGLMTNDIRHLEDAANKSLYCMFLNVQGRILHDALIYPLDSSYLIETADQSGKDLLAHLNRYRIRRKVALNLLDPKEWRVYHVSEESFENRPTDGVQIVARDPRVKELGWRCVTTNSFQEQLIDGAASDRYTELRYRLGVSEGAGDLKIASSFPLECNCDYLHGVSFHKGCYIGQELTARTHHTGVVRKRIMPIKFESPPLDGVDIDAPILNEKGANVGKVRAVMLNGLYGLGLLRVQQALSANELKIGNLKISTERPAWWPIEAPKEIMEVVAKQELAQDEGGVFKCFVCNWTERYHGHGFSLPFARGITFNEDAYCMRDPFAPYGANLYVCLGAPCSVCLQLVCLSCSVFYSKRFCRECALKNLSDFPAEIQKKVKELDTPPILDKK